MTDKQPPTRNSEQQDMNVTLSEQPSELNDDLLDKQWAELTQDWQAQPVEKTDIKKLLKQTKSRTHRAKALFYINIVATVGLFISWIYGTFVAQWENKLNHYLIICAVMSLVFVVYEYKIRQQVWQSIANGGPDDALQNALKGLESSISYIRLTKWSFIPFGGAANWFLLAVAEDLNKPVMPFLIEVNGYLALCFAVTYWFDVKRKREYKALLTRIKNL